MLDWYVEEMMGQKPIPEQFEFYVAHAETDESRPEFLAVYQQFRNSIGLQRGKADNGMQELMRELSQARLMLVVWMATIDDYATCGIPGVQALIDGETTRE